MTDSPRAPYRLVWPEATGSGAPSLDPSQRAVVAHAAVPGCGPALVLAGPGTGKTTTLVEAVVARVAAGTPADRVLVLTFARKAAQELRARLGARLPRGTSAPLAWTFHGFCATVLAEAAAADPEATARPVLLSGPEQDVAMRELVAGALEDGRADWPAELGPALPTRGFADELRQLLARARSLGLEPAELAAASARADWRSAARFFEEYLQVLDARGVLDYAELVLRAARHLQSPAGGGIADRYDLVLVDEYQDTDPAQEGLLQSLAGSGRDLVVVGDPDQSIYGFRGADVRGILAFRQRFRRSDGQPAALLTLEVCRRSGPELLAASRSVVASLPLVAGVPVERATAHRVLTTEHPPAAEPAEVVQVRTYPDEAVEGAAVADLLRREHLERGRPWGSMAVLVRSVAIAGPRLRRALLAAGVPVEVAADELPLAVHPAVAPLLLALACAADRARDLPRGRLGVERAETLLLSPLGGADAGALRRLGRALRAQESPADGPPRASAALLRDALEDPRLLAGLDPAVSAPARRVGALLDDAARLVRAQAPAYDVLWSVWSATPWPQRLERAARRGGADGHRADQDLDAVLALFDAAARHDEQAPGRGVANFQEVLAAQQIPGDTLAEAGVRPGGVRLLTAHRSKGLEWDVVVVAGVQEQGWPDVRRRGSLLEADRLGREGLEPPPPASALLAEERRLFYVAVTRARARLVVTAVASPLDDGPQPSRFLDDLGVAPRHVERLDRRPLALAALVAELRRVAGDSGSSPAVRAAAVERLATLAATEVSGRALVPAADPDRWWGVAEPTRSAVPLRPVDQPVRLSGSSLRDLGTCPARWALAHEARAEGPRSSATGFGSVIHALAQGVDLGVLPPDLDTLMSRIDDVWPQLEFAAPWQRGLERAEACEALSRFLVWHREQADAGRRLLGAEAHFVLTCEVPIADPDGAPGAVLSRSVRLEGWADRLDVDAEGGVVVVDYKTSRQAPTREQVGVDAQLGVYQLAVEADAFEVVRPASGGGGTSNAGAELVQLRTGRAEGRPQVLQQPALRAPAAGREALDPEGDGSRWMDGVLAGATARLVHELLPAVPGEHCKHCAFVASCPAREAGRQVIA